VADEVRTLAQRTADATAEIGSLIGTIGKEVKHVSVGISAIGERADQLSGEAHSITDQVNLISQVTQTVKNSLEYASSLSFLEAVKIDHVVWKSQVYDHIREEDGNVDKLPDHTSCRLGNWYFKGAGYKNYRTYQSYLRLDEPHRNVHDNGFKALQACRAGKHSQVVMYLEKMEYASDRVIEVISSLEEEIHTRFS